jgi:hypothetical protein
MQKNHPWMRNAPDLHIELLQSREEGKDVTGYAGRVAAIQAMPADNPHREKLAGDLLDEMLALPVQKGHLFHEPNRLEEIQTLRPLSALKWATPVQPPDDAVMYDKLYGAWLARCAGCLLGQPIEGWRRDRILGLLRDTGNYPVSRFISSDIGDPLRKKYGVSDDGQVYGSSKRNWINNVSFMPEDDDTNYTLLGLKILETYGFAFTPEDVAEAWLMNLPLLHVCTAERVAYRNLCNSIPPPDSASYRNVYREWIGAQIRADFHGYATPGNPALGAELAWRDGVVSHVRNGLYGEMLVAAMLSAAAVLADIREVLDAGLSQIPAESRLSLAIRDLLSWKEVGGLSWEAVLDRIHERYDEANSHDWCHTISNALVVCTALLYGRLDLGTTLGIAIAGALDTDCNAATAGSVVGMMVGASQLPSSWTAPLCDTLKSGVDGFGMVKISDMARRSLDVVKIGKSGSIGL